MGSDLFICAAEGAVQLANRRLIMNRTREILRLRHVQAESVRATERAVGVGRSAVSETYSRATEAGLDWEAYANFRTMSSSLQQRPLWRWLEGDRD